MRCTCPRIAQEARLGAVAVKLSRQMKKPLHKTTALALVRFYEIARTHFSTKC